MCVTPVASVLRRELSSSAPEGAGTSIHKIVRALESGLSYQFHASWGLVLQLFSTVYKVYFNHYYGKSPKILNTLFHTFLA